MFNIKGEGYIKLCSSEIVALVSSAALILAQKYSADELETLSLAFNQLSDTLDTIIQNENRLCKINDKKKCCSSNKSAGNTQDADIDFDIFKENDSKKFTPLR
jgi:hypothetical protein